MNVKIPLAEFKERVRKSTVLIIEPDKKDLAEFKRILSKICHVIAVKNAATATEYLKANSPDLILFNFELPDSTAIDFVNSLRNRQKTRSIVPVLIGNDDSVPRTRLGIPGLDTIGIFVKPYNEIELQAGVQMFLECAFFYRNYIKLPPMEQPADINEEEGLKNCGSMELYITAIKGFVFATEQGLKDIRCFYEEEDYKNYTIRVHALKSEARLVGALGLSERARRLEMASKEGRVEEIRENTEELLAVYEEVSDKLDRSFIRKKSDNCEMIDPAMFRDVLEEMGEFVGIRDFESIEGCMEMLSKYRMPESFEQQFRRLEKAIFEQDAEAIKEIIKSAGEGDH